MSRLSDTDSAKRKQWIKLGSIIAAIGAVSAATVVLTDDSTPSGVTRKADVKPKSFIAPGDKVDPQDAWRGVADSRLSTSEARVAKLESELALLKKTGDAKAKLANLESKANGKSSDAGPEIGGDDDLDRRLKEFEKKSPKAYPPDTPSTIKPNAVHSAQPNARQPSAAPPAAVSPPQEGQIETVTFRRPEKLGIKTGYSANGQSQGQSSESKAVLRTTQNYLPSGMFGPARVLSGLDAPTGGQAQSNPHPVLLELTDLANLPNQYRYDWKYCRITAAGHGDISSERAYIRTESMSCVSKDGQRVLDVPLKGYIAGEDGKAGMRGRLVSKQGQALANALLAGVVSGIGSGLSESSKTTSVSALGSTSTVNPGDAYKAGIGEGVGKALDRLSNYYIQLAEKMFPVIEIDANREVDVILTKGVPIDVDLEDL